MAQSAYQLEALIRRNAEACEQAKKRYCRCHCKGALHGQRHSNEWIKQTAQDFYNQQFENQEDQD